MGMDCINLYDIGLVILSYNRVKELKQNLPELCSRLLEHGAQIVIVDNFSSDGSRDYLLELKRMYPGLVLVLNSHNMGVSGGRNSGRRLIEKRFILHLDDDTRIAVDDIVSLCRIMNDNRDIGVLSPKIIHPGTLCVQNDHGVGLCDVGNYHGACHLVRRESMVSVGDIDPLCTFGGEELDYSIRMRSAGYRVCYTSDISVFHNNIVRANPEAKWRRRMRVYNFTRIHFKHFPLPIALIFSFRYFISQFISAIHHFNFLFSISLFFDLCRGVYQGRRCSNIVSQDVVSYYARGDIRPDYGNVPIFLKVLNRLKNRIN